MKNFFQHTPDNYINIADEDNNSISMLLSDFIQYEPSYVLPSPYVGQQYYPDDYHAYFDEEGNQLPAEFPWSDGDYYISRVTYYIDNPLPPPTPTLSEAKAQKITALNTLRATKLSSGVYYTAIPDYFPAINYSANAIIAYQIAGNVPGGFSIPNLSNFLVPLTLAQLLTLDAGISEFFRLCSINVINKTNAINALSTVNDVLNYEITTGWPVVPYAIT